MTLNTQSLIEVDYDLGEYQLRGLTNTQENKRIVLCLHGWLDNAASFVPMLDHLTEYKIIAIDWPGHGLSSHRSMDAHYHFLDWVYDLLQLFELNKWQKIDIVAHSMGGMIASAFTAAFPEKVNSLTLIDSIGFISSEIDQTTEQLRKGMLSRMKQHTKNKSKHPSISSAVKARVAVSDLSEEQAKLIVTRGLEKHEDYYLWRADSRLRNTSPYRLTMPQAEQFIKDIKIPVQLIYGSDGIEFINSALAHFGPLFEQFSSHRLIGGHHLHMEKPQETAKLVSKFIKNNS